VGYIMLWALAVIASFFGAAALPRVRGSLLAVGILLLLAPVALIIYLLATVELNDLHFG
jgi:hypothetical protein